MLLCILCFCFQYHFLSNQSGFLAMLLAEFLKRKKKTIVFFFILDSIENGQFVIKPHIRLDFFLFPFEIKLPFEWYSFKLENIFSFAAKNFPSFANILYIVRVVRLAANIIFSFGRWQFFFLLLLRSSVFAVFILLWTTHRETERETCLYSLLGC